MSPLGIGEAGDEEGPPRCPGCGRVMSDREAGEQGACNDCYDSAWARSLSKWRQ